MISEETPLKWEGVSKMRGSRFAHIIITLQILVRVWGHKLKIVMMKIVYFIFKALCKIYWSMNIHHVSYYLKRLKSKHFVVSSKELYLLKIITLRISASFLILHTINFISAAGTDSGWCGAESWYICLGCSNVISSNILTPCFCLSTDWRTHTHWKSCLQLITFMIWY